MSSSLWIRDHRGRPRRASYHQVLTAARALLERRVRRGAHLGSVTAAVDYLVVRLAELEREVFVAVYLDARHRVIAAPELFRGSLRGAQVHPREVIKEALAHNAAAVFVAHNHPSGVAEPSAADQLLTDRLRAALAYVDVELLDHFVVAGGRATSLLLWNGQRRDIAHARRARGSRRQRRG